MALGILRRASTDVSAKTIPNMSKVMLQRKKNLNTGPAGRSKKVVRSSESVVNLIRICSNANKNDFGKTDE